MVAQDLAGPGVKKSCSRGRKDHCRYGCVAGSRSHDDL